MNGRNLGLASRVSLLMVSLAIAVGAGVGCNKKEEPLPADPAVVAPKPGKSVTTYNWAEEKKSATSSTKWSEEKWKQYCKDHNYSAATCSNAVHRHAVQIGVDGLTSTELLKKLNEDLKK